MAKDDISFVMLGTRSKGAVDPYFHKNIQNATANGVKVGVYIYSLATTTDMAVQEADFVLNLITDYPISYPVAFDMEDSTQGNLSKSELAAIANAFCKRISAAGYYPIIYANENWLKNKHGYEPDELSCMGSTLFCPPNLPESGDVAGNQQWLCKWHQNKSGY